MYEAGSKKRDSDKRRYRSFRPRSNLANLLPRANQTTKALPTEREDEVTRELAKFRKYPLDYKVTDSNTDELVVFKDGTTPRYEGEKWFGEYVVASIDNLMADYYYGATETELDKYYQFLTKDPVGINSIPFTDRTVWKRNDNVNSDDSAEDDDPPITKSDKFTRTEFGDSLDLYQKMMYKILRASLPIYLDKVANERFSLWITSRGTHP